MIFKTVLGRCHKNVRSINVIACMLNDKDETKKAMKIYADAQAMCEKVLGREHENIAASLNFMATLVQEKGEMEKPLTFFKETLSIEETLVEREHRDTVTTISSIANSLYENDEIGGHYLKIT